MELEEFVVIDTERFGYVESIDTCDGDVEITTDPRQARIFRGPEWQEFWAHPRYMHVPVEMDVIRI